jgi:succinate-acetate transporter protein
MTSHTAPPLTDALTVLFSAAAAGYTGFGVGILGLYGCFASVVNATWHRTVIPLGSRE